jgi:hypothetical protein
MSARADKKRRKTYREMYRHQLVKPIEQSIMDEEQVRLFKSLIKPKPRWMPSFVYWWCFRTVFK